MSVIVLLEFHPRNLEGLVLINHSSRTGREHHVPYHKRRSSAVKVDVEAGAVVGAATPDRRLVKGSEMTVTAMTIATTHLNPTAAKRRGEDDIAAAAMPTTEESPFVESVCSVRHGLFLWNIASVYKLTTLMMAPGDVLRMMTVRARLFDQAC